MRSYLFYTSPYYTRLSSVFVAFALIFSFGLHTVDTNHTHPNHVHEHGESSGTHGGSAHTIGAYAHMAEKKWLYTLIVGTLFASFIPLIAQFSWSAFLKRVVVMYARYTRWLWGALRVFEDTLTRLFARGILHPRPY